MSGLITCRLCKGNKKPTEISGTLSDIEETTEKGPLELRHYISFYCHVDLSSDENLSQAVCKLCRCIFETFVTFSYNLSESEHNYIAAASNVSLVNTARSKKGYVYNIIQSAYCIN